jgi:type I restriction enzyme M protein
MSAIKLCTIIQKIAEGLIQFSTDADTLGDAYEYLIRTSNLGLEP